MTPPLLVLVLADPADPRLRHLDPAPPGVRFVVGATAGDVASEAPHADAVLAWWTERVVLDPVLASAPRARWVHSAAAGLDRLLSPTVIAHPSTLTNSRGVFSGALAEFALLGMLYFAKDVPRLRRAQAARRWDPFEVGLLRGRTVGIAGYGDIGRAVAVLAHAAGMKVRVFRRRPERSHGDPLVAETATSMIALAEGADHLVVAAPLTDATRHLVDAAVLAALPPHAVVINVGRGPLVDEDALVAALAAGRLGGAALDVFATEPLPETHPLWRLDNVLVSPHTADRTATWLDEAMALFLDNLARFVAGGPLRNVVEKHAGY